MNTSTTKHGGRGSHGHPATLRDWITAALAVMVWAACVALAAIGPNAHAQDSWTGRDKVEHAAGSAVLGAAAALVIEDKATAWAVAMVPGLLKEAYDAQHPEKHTASWRDMAANAVGAWVGVNLGARWGDVLIGPRWVRWSIK